MSERRWKAVERRLARDLNGSRIPIAGRAGRPDVDAGWLAVESKSRLAVPQWLALAVRQARSQAGPSQLGIAIVHEVGTRYDDAIVCMSLGDFRSWFGDAP